MKDNGHTSNSLKIPDKLPFRGAAGDKESRKSLMFIARFLAEFALSAAEGLGMTRFRNLFQQTARLDHAVEGIRSQEIDDTVLEQAAQRVWARLAADVQPSPAPAEDGRIRGCADFQSLIPAYLVGNLSEARTLLLEDHTRECVACRGALHALRHGAARKQVHATAHPRQTPRWIFALGGAAAVMILVVAAMVEGLFPGLMTGGGSRATVESVNGSLYEVREQNTAPLARGGEIRAGEQIRTGPGSTAEIRLVNGSLVEMSARADFFVTHGWFGSTIHLEQGGIIVQTSHRDSGRLSVQTPDCWVSDKGTIFAVTQGMKGSRVAVIRGEVKVRQGGRSQWLRAGGQFSSQPSLAQIPIGEQISWSPNASHYLALMGELAGIEKQLEAMPGPAPRYRSDLVKYLLANTVIYAAIPNLEPTLSNANRLIQDRLSTSPVLRQWWQKQQASGAAGLMEEILGKVQTFSGYLGNEIVIAAGQDGPTRNLTPVVLAQVRKPGFRDYLEKQLDEFNLGKTNLGFRIIDHAASLSPQSNKSPQILILLENNVILVGSDPRELRQMAALIHGGRSSAFTRTDFYSAIGQAYHAGAGWLFSADLEQVLANSVHKNEAGRPEAGAKSEMGNVRYLVAQSKSTQGKPENSVVVTFSGKRYGLSSWLAAPSPMGTLNFVSPQATAVVSFVLRDPGKLVEEILNSGGHPGLSNALRQFETSTGVSVRDDLASSLGGEVTIAQDGPLLPAPQWVAALDVYHQQRLQNSLEKIVAAFNRKLSGAAGTLQLTREKNGGRVFYALRINRSKTHPGQPTASLPTIYYTFADGYMVLASSRSQLVRAIEDDETGYTLVRSQPFQAQLPLNGNANFSGLVYENLGERLGPMMREFEGNQSLSPTQRNSLQRLAAHSTPILIGAYGEPDRIKVVTNQSLLGFGVNSILGTAGAVLDLSHLMGEHMKQTAGPPEPRG